MLYIDTRANTCTHVTIPCILTFKYFPCSRADVVLCPMSMSLLLDYNVIIKCGEILLEYQCDYRISMELKRKSYLMSMFFDLWSTSDPGFITTSPNINKIRSKLGARTWPKPPGGHFPNIKSGHCDPAWLPDPNPYHTLWVWVKHTQVRFTNRSTHLTHLLNGSMWVWNLSHLTCLWQFIWDICKL